MFLIGHSSCAVPHSLLLDSWAIKIGVEFCDLSLDCIRFAEKFSSRLLRSRIIFFQILFEILPNCCGACDDILFDFIFIYNAFSLLNWANDCGLRFKIETESAEIES